MSMTTQLVFDKTSKGQEEIATRRHGLPSRLRSLLVLIDGKTSVESLIKKVAGLGLSEESIAELLEHEYIVPHEGAAPAHAAHPTAPIPPAAHTAPLTAPAAKAPSSPAVLPEGETQFEALYHFYTTTIKSTLGLRGFTMQMKVERCANIEDFRTLRSAYVEAVQKSKGDEMARSLGARLDQLLNLG
jgi:hypothetical protein